MAKGCRDCKRCAESAAFKLAAGPWRLTGGLAGALTVGLFKRHCPQCGHKMGDHKMVGEGAERRFQD